MVAMIETPPRNAPSRRSSTASSRTSLLRDLRRIKTIYRFAASRSEGYPRGTPEEVAEEEATAVDVDDEDVAADD